MVLITKTRSDVIFFSYPKLVRLARLAVPVLAAIVMLGYNGVLMGGGIISRDEKLHSLRRRQSTETSAYVIGDQIRKGKHPDGFFNNLPVHREKFTEKFHSNAHCIGENFVEDSNPKLKSNGAWKYRSCRFQNLCFDAVEREFVLFLSDEQRALENALTKAGRKHQFWPAASYSSDGMAVSVGGVHPRMGHLDHVLKWYPKFRNVRQVMKEDDGFYMLPSDYVFVPWNSFHGHNAGHILTDDFLPIYTLLSCFDFADKELAMIHIDLPDVFNNSTTRWDNCQNKPDLCEPYMEKFLPLLGTELRKTSTQYTAALDAEVEARYVCAAHGVAGMGMLTDHGKKLHGNFETDFAWTHNIGRGDSFHRFRDWMVGRLLGANVEEKRLSRAPYRIVVSNNSSTDPLRNVSFEKHAEILRKELGTKYELDIREVRLSEMSMADQVELAAGASIFITAAGGGVSAAHFLPQGASLLIYFAEFPPDKEVKTGNYNGWVMDWDTYNNFGYVRTHWLPIRRRNENDVAKDDGGQSVSDMNVLVKLVDEELDLISHIDDYG